MSKNKIAKLTSYGSYLDCEFTTAKYPDDEVHIVGDLAEYVYDLEQESDKKDQKIAELEKALELACKQYYEDCGLEDCPYGENETFDKKYDKCKTCPNGGDMTINKDGCCWIDYFKFKAQEELNNDR